MFTAEEIKDHLIHFLTGADADIHQVAASKLSTLNQAEEISVQDRVFVLRSILQNPRGFDLDLLARPGVLSVMGEIARGYFETLAEIEMLRQTEEDAVLLAALGACRALS